MRNKLANQNSQQESQEKVESNVNFRQLTSTTTEIKEEVLTSTTKKVAEIGNSNKDMTKSEKEIIYIKQPVQVSESERQAEIEKAVQEALAKQQQSQSETEPPTLGQEKT